MRFIRPTIADRRIQRFHRWALLWLTWLAALFENAAKVGPISAQAEAIGHAWLDQIERLILNIIMLRAAPRVRGIRTTRPFAAHRRKDRALRRAIIGSALRRALRRQHVPGRIAALSQNIDALSARLLKRLPRGLTRRRAILVRPEARVSEAVCALPAPARCVDSS